MQNKIEVNICGKSLVLISDESTDYMLRIAAYVNNKINDMKNINNSNSNFLLLSINIADELFKLRKKNEILEKDIAKLRTELVKTDYKFKKDEFKKKE
jgi:Uncharacterized protein conserved in bacteria